MTTTDAWRPALDMLHTGRGDPLSFVANALRADPHWVAGHCLRAALLVMACREDADEQLEQTLNAAQALDAHADERERRHLAAAHAWLSRDLKGALRQYGAIAADHPHDTLALKVVHFGEFAWGSMDRLRKRTAAALGHWREGMHGYDHVLAMHAFALVESSDIAQAEQVARRALAIDAGNAAAIHALAHVIEMQGRSTEGIGWLRSCEADWVDNPAYAVHLWWHLALFHLDRGDIAAVLRIHDEHLTVHADAPASTLVDASALLWRLHLRGVDSIDRLQSLADAWERQPLGVLRPFSDTHAMLAYVAAGRRDSCLRLIAALRRNAAGARDLDPVIQVAALPVCEALMAFGAGRYAEAVARTHDPLRRQQGAMRFAAPDLARSRAARWPWAAGPVAGERAHGEAAAQRLQPPVATARAVGPVGRRAGRSWHWACRDRFDHGQQTRRRRHRSTLQSMKTQRHIDAGARSFAMRSGLDMWGANIDHPTRLETAVHGCVLRPWRLSDKNSLVASEHRPRACGCAELSSRNDGTFDCGRGERGLHARCSRASQVSAMMCEADRPTPNSGMSANGSVVSSAMRGSCSDVKVRPVPTATTKLKKPNTWMRR